MEKRNQSLFWAKTLCPLQYTCLEIDAAVAVFVKYSEDLLNKNLCGILVQLQYFSMVESDLPSPQ